MWERKETLLASTRPVAGVTSRRAAPAWMHRPLHNGNVFALFGKGNPAGLRRWEAPPLGSLFAVPLGDEGGSSVVTDGIDWADGSSYGCRIWCSGRRGES